VGGHGVGCAVRNIAANITTPPQDRNHRRQKTSMEHAVEKKLDSRKKTIVLEDIIRIVVRDGRTRSGQPNGLKLNTLFTQDMAEAQPHHETENQEQPQHRCSLCPEVGNGPPQPNLDDPAFSDLRCGHQVHTHCLLTFVLSMRIRRHAAHTATCAICDIPLVDGETIQYYENLYEDNEQPQRRKTVKELWETNPEFKNDIKAYKKAMTEFNVSYRAFNKEAKVIRTRFLQNVDTSVQLIRDQKRVSVQEFKRIQSRRIFMSKSNRLTRLKNQIRAIYGMSLWDIADALKDIEGAPKIRRAFYYSWKIRPDSFFRIRI